MCNLFRTVLLALVLFSLGLEGAILEWGFVKGRGGVVSADNQAPSVTVYDVEIYVDTSVVGDATSVTISGGNINGSLAFELDGTEWFYNQDFQNEAAMDAVFPNNSNYTITLSGGSLGTLTQSVSVGAKAYPDLPYLVGSGYSELQAFNPINSFDFNFAAPSTEADLTIVEIEANGESPFEAFVDASQTTINLPENTLSSGVVYEGYFDHVNQVIQSGSSGFGIDGAVYHTAYSRFDLDTASANSIIGGWLFGDSESDGSGVVVFMKDGTYYLVEDTENESGDPDGFERGTYTWNSESGAFTASALTDSNGEAGLSHPTGSTTVVVAGDALTYSDSEGSNALTRIKGGDIPLVGAWQYGEGRAIDSRILVFLPSGIYFEAQEFGQQLGMEKGSYTWDQETGIFDVTVLVDTDEALAFSNEREGFRISVRDDELMIYDGDQEWRLYLVDPTTVGYPVPQVTHWRFVKGKDHFQNRNNTAPVAAAWSVLVAVETKMNQDALQMEIRGGEIPGAYPLIHNTAHGWTFEKEYHSEAAMNAEFPPGAEFTIELSGGNLGTMSQTFRLMADEYPNTPYLTGTHFTAAQSFDSFTDLTLNWSNPGELTEENGQTIFEVSRFYDDEILFRESNIGAATQGVVPAGTVWPGHTFYGYLEFIHARTLSGVDGFGIDGLESRNTATDFTLATPDSPLAGGWSYGDPSGDGSGVLVFLNNGTYFHVEDVSASDSDPDGFERGEYTWDRDSGALSVETIRDTNGTVGLSNLGDSLTATISGSSLSITDGGAPSAFTKVSSSSDALVGGWQWGDGNQEYGGIFVFLDNGYYFQVEYSEPLGLLLEGGIERGTYSFSEDGIEFIASAITDTNGEQGLSHVDGMWSGGLFNDQFGLNDNRGGYSMFDAEKAEIMNRIWVSEASLENAFRSTLGKSGGSILRLELQRILRMDASGLGLTDLNGFEEAINMKELDLSNNALEDIWQVGDMRELRFLDLSRNQISDISYLSN